MVPKSALLNVILLETLDMKTSVTFLTNLSNFFISLFAASVHALQNIPMLMTVIAYVAQKFVRSTPHALVRWNFALGQVPPLYF